MQKHRFAVISSTFLALTGAMPALADQRGSLDSVNWLLGNWISESESKLTGESWNRVSPYSFEGAGTTRSKTDNRVLQSESLRLLEMSGEVFYLAKVRHNNYPVPFKLTACPENSAVFENSKHDFPNRLEYRLLDSNRLQVSVGGGSGEEFILDFRRTSN